MGGADEEMPCYSNILFAAGGSGVCSGAGSGACNGADEDMGVCAGASGATGPISCGISLMVAIACCSKSLHLATP